MIFTNKTRSSSTKQPKATRIKYKYLNKNLKQLTKI